jgi:hypothetical protein
MRHHLRLAAALFAIGLPSATALAQTPENDRSRRASAVPGVVFPDRFGQRAQLKQAQHTQLSASDDSWAYPSGRRSDIQLSPYHRRDDETGRYRYAPLVPRYQNENPPNIVPRFGGAQGAPDRQEQLQAQMVGVARYNAFQQHLDNYGRPFYGFGFGFGFPIPIR